MKNYLYIGKKSFIVFDTNMNILTKKNNEGIIDFENIQNPVESVNSLSSFLREIHKLHPFKEIVIFDIAFNSQVIDVPGLPISHSKRNEVLLWKLDNILPYKVDSYSLKYRIVERDRVLFYALPVTLYNTLNRALASINLKCWDILPESYFLFENFLKEENKTLFFLDRNYYFTAMFIKDKEIVYIKSRKKVKKIPVKQEVNIVESVILKKLKTDIGKKLYCSRQFIEGFEKKLKGFDFED